MIDLHGRATPGMALRYEEAFRPYAPLFLDGVFHVRPGVRGRASTVSRG